jgi:transcriptional regulator GlxA family with amidase domain
MRIQVLVLDGAFDVGLAAILDTLATANDLATDGGGRAEAPFAVERVGVRRGVRTQQGLSVPVAALERGRAPDLVIVPALGCKTPDTVEAALGRRDVHDAVAWLRGRAAAGAQVTAACTATFVLAETGLLDGGLATTTWWLAPLFRQRFPRVELDESRMIVESGRLATAGAALAHLDLALWVVRRRSPALAALTARYLIVDSRSSQASYAIPDHLAHNDPIVERFEKWARRHLVERFSLDRAARAVGTSERTLARRLDHVLGKTPLQYVQDLRVERAVHLLQTSDGSVDEIASAVGYADGVTLRSLLRRKTGRGVRELRSAG